MASNVPDNAMVLGTAAGTAIPLSTARPKFSKVLGAVAEEVIIMPEDLNLVTVYSDANFEIVAAATAELDTNGWAIKSFKGIAGVFYDMFLPKTIMLTSSGTTTLNCLEKWASIANEGQYITS